MVSPQTIHCEPFTFASTACTAASATCDGWMTGIHQRTGWPVGRVRTGIEVIALSIGWLLGGTVGIGTLMFAVLIGPSVAYGLMLAGAIGGVPGHRMVSEDEFPELDA